MNKDCTQPLDQKEVNLLAINGSIADLKAKGALEVGKVSDTFHTFDELYEHRCRLYIALLKAHSARPCYNRYGRIWRSRLHFDCTMYPGYFILGAITAKNEQISYHLPLSMWAECSFALTRETAPEWDGHTADDVLKRLKHL